VARTDARGPMGMQEALDRCMLFKQAGADILFVDGPQSLEELELIGRELPGPLLANMSETGLTPLRSAQELQQMGFAIALFPSSTVRLTIKAVDDFLTDLKKQETHVPGSTRWHRLSRQTTHWDSIKSVALSKRCYRKRNNPSLGSLR